MSGESGGRADLWSAKGIFRSLSSFHLAVGEKEQILRRLCPVWKRCFADPVLPSCAAPFNILPGSSRFSAALFFHSMPAVLVATQRSALCGPSRVRGLHLFVHSLKKQSCSRETISNEKKIYAIIGKTLDLIWNMPEAGVHGRDLRNLVNQQIWVLFCAGNLMHFLPLVLSTESFSEPFTNCAAFCCPAEQHSCCAQCPLFSCLSGESLVRWWSWLRDVAKGPRFPSISWQTGNISLTEWERICLEINEK